MSQQPPEDGAPADLPIESAASPEGAEAPAWSPTVPLPQQPTTRLPQAPAGTAGGWAQAQSGATWTGDEGNAATPPPGVPQSGVPQSGAPQYWTPQPHPDPSNPPTEVYQPGPTQGYPSGAAYPPAPPSYQGYPGGTAVQPGSAGPIGSGTHPGPPANPHASAGPGGPPPHPAYPAYPGAPAGPSGAPVYPGPGGLSPSPYAGPPAGPGGPGGPTAYQPPGQPSPWGPSGPGGPAGPGGPGWVPPGGPPQKSGSKVPLLVGGGVLAAVLAVGGVVVLPKVLGGTSTPGPTSGSGTTTTAAPVPKASEAVQAYLDALASGDGPGAVALLDAPGDKTLLTSEALKAGGAKGTISGITVTPDTSDTPSTVSATYTVGADATTYDFPVVKRAAGWKILKGTAKVTVRGAAQGFVPVKVNGVAVAAGAPSELPVFPGSYTYTSAAPALALTGEVTATVLNPSTVKGPTTLPWALADAAGVLNAAKASFGACQAVKSLVPPNCPFGLKLRSQTVSDPATIAWKLRNDPWAGVAPAVDQANPLVVTLTIAPAMRSEAKVTENGRTFSGFLDVTYTSTAKVDLASGTAKVTWEYTQKT